jgi:hypothetical protein
MRHKPGRHPDNVAPVASNPAPSPAVNFNIGGLTMEGYAPAEQKRFTQSLQSRLTELAKAHHQSDWSAGLRMNRLDAGQLPVGATPEQAARHIALQIFSKITQQTGGKHHA